MCVFAARTPHNATKTFFFCESKQKESSHWEHIFFYDLYLNFNNRAAKQDGAEQSQTTSSNWVPKSVVNGCFDGVSTKLVNIVLFSVRWRGGSLLRVFENAFFFGGGNTKALVRHLGLPLRTGIFPTRACFPPTFFCSREGKRNGLDIVHCYFRVTRGEICAGLKTPSSSNWN